MAGTSRISYPSNIRIIRVPCSGRVDPLLIVKSFQQGADGVLVAGCHPGDCHYISGNYKTLRRYHLLKNMLRQFGVEEGRFRLEWVSAGEGIRFQQVINDFVDQIVCLGPIG